MEINFNYNIKSKNLLNFNFKFTFMVAFMTYILIRGINDDKTAIIFYAFAFNCLLLVLVADTYKPLVEIKKVK